MSWHFSAALVAEYLEASSSDGTQSPPWSSLPFAPDDSCSAKMKDTSHRSPFGTMFVPSMDTLGTELLTWFLEGSRAKTYQPPEREPGFLENDLACGAKWHGSFARLSQNGSWLKTAPFLFLEDSEPFLETWPKWGTMRNGECWERMTPEPRTKGREFGSWATPQASDCRRVVSTFGSTLRNKKDVPELGTSAGWLNPELSEWLMGWPEGWTACEPLGTDKFQQWRQWHSDSFQITFRMK